MYIHICICTYTSLYIYTRSGTFSQAASFGNIVLQSYLASTTPITKTSFEKYSVSKSRSIDGCRNVFSRNIDHNIVFVFATDLVLLKMRPTLDLSLVVRTHLCWFVAPPGDPQGACYVTKQSLCWGGFSNV